VLADSNTVIYSARPAFAHVRSFVIANVSSVSAITILEVLGYHRLIPADRADFEIFFRQAKILPITDVIIDRAVELRQQKKMGLADAIIAATALVHNLPLVTRNTADYKHIAGLQLIDPFANP